MANQKVYEERDIISGFLTFLEENNYHVADEIDQEVSREDILAEYFGD